MAEAVTVEHLKSVQDKMSNRITAMEQKIVVMSRVLTKLFGEDAPASLKNIAEGPDAQPIGIPATPASDEVTKPVSM